MFIPEKNIFNISKLAATIYFKNLKYIVAIVAISFLPVFLLTTFLPQGYLSDFNSFLEILTMYVVGQINILDFNAMIASYQGAFMFIYLSLGIELLFFPVSVAGITYLVYMHIKKSKPSFDGMFTASVARFLKLAFTTALVVIPLGLLFLSFNMFFIIVGVYFGITIIFYQHIVADMGRFGSTALSLSRFIVRGRFFKTLLRFGLLVFFYIAASWMLDILSIFLNISNMNIIIRIIYFLFRHIVLAYFSVVFACWYFDIKRFYILPVERVFNFLSKNDINKENKGD